jgi:hypothetical protein
MKPLDAFFAGCAITVITAFLVMIIINQNQNQSKTPEQTITTGVHITYQPNSRMINKDTEYEVINLKDYRRNLQWDAIYVDRSFVIIPGTENPIKPKCGKSLNEVSDEIELILRK